MRLMSYLDAHKDVLEWASEEFSIPYVSPIDGRVHRYFPDFWIKQRNRTTGAVEIRVIEVKPAKQTKPPPAQTRRTKRYINEVVTWGINEAKWKAATNYCNHRGWIFSIMTEKELGIK
jgi:TnsA endonuclease N terminal